MGKRTVILDTISPAQIGTTDYVDVYEINVGDNRININEFILQLNSDSFLLRVETDGNIVIDVDLSDLALNFGLDMVSDFSLRRYDIASWIFQPKQPLKADTNFKISLKGKIAALRISRGLVVWGER